jgi:hypothetical protein
MKATAEQYPMLTMSMVLITAVSTRLIKLLYDPSGQFARAKLEHARLSTDLRVLTWLYSEDHAAPRSTCWRRRGRHATRPMSLIVLHLTELVGRTVSLLKPHRKSTISSNSGNLTPLDRNVKGEAVPRAKMMARRRKSRCGRICASGAARNFTQIKWVFPKC